MSYTSQEKLTKQFPLATNILDLEEAWQFYE